MLFVRYFGLRESFAACESFAAAPDMRSFAPFCALVHSFADLRLRSFVLICTLSASDRV